MNQHEKSSPIVKITVTGSPSDWHLRVVHVGQEDDNHRRGSGADKLVARFAVLYVELPESAQVRLHVFGVAVPWIDIRELADDVRLLCDRERAPETEIEAVRVSGGDVDELRARLEYAGQRAPVRVAASKVVRIRQGTIRGPGAVGVIIG